MGAIVAFFTLTYVASWTLFIASAAIVGGNAPPPGRAALATAVRLAGVFAPALVALALTAWTTGRAGVSALVGRVGEWPNAARWYVFAVGYMAAIKLTAALVHRMALGGWPAFGQESILIMAGAIVVSTPVQAGEEIGWRGYALPRLSARLGLPLASIVLGIVWAAWHLPFFVISGIETSGQSFPLYVVSVTALSVAFAWLYWRTNASLLMTMLLHAAVNNTKDIVPSAAPAAATPFHWSASAVGWLAAGLLWICAAYFLVRMRHATLPDFWQSPDVRRRVEPAASP